MGRHVSSPRKGGADGRRPSDGVGNRAKMPPTDRLRRPVPPLLAEGKCYAQANSARPEMLVDYAVSALLTLFVVVDPIGLAPTFLAVTDGLPRGARRNVAVRASIIAGVILIGAALIGNWLLDTLEISLAAFRIAGGLLLFSIASQMVFGVRMRREGEEAEQAGEEHLRN